jgi:hypothetical protein
MMTPFVVYALVRLALPAVVDGIFEWFATRNDVEGYQQMDTGPLHPVGLLLAAVATVAVAREMWGRRQSTEAWAKGASGEVATGRLLDSLPHGFAVRHDVPMPGSRANIDHVVVGPAGVFTIETKNYQHGVQTARGRVTSAGRRRKGMVDQAQRQSDAISALTEEVVRPIVVVHGGVQVGWFSSPIVGGVRFCGPRRLTKAVTGGDRTLSPAKVVAMLARLDPAEPMSPAQASLSETAGCSCGGDWVTRHRRSDGAPFLGCSHFPSCRRTQNLAQGSATT